MVDSLSFVRTVGALLNELEVLLNGARGVDVQVAQAVQVLLNQRNQAGKLGALKRTIILSHELHKDRNV